LRARKAAEVLVRRIRARPRVVAAPLVAPDYLSYLRATLPPGWTADARHINAKQRRELVVTLRKSRGWSNVMIAEVFGVDETTIRRDFGSGSTFVEPAEELPDRVIGKDGKSYPAWRPKSITARNAKEEQKATMR